MKKNRLVFICLCAAMACIQGPGVENAIACSSDSTVMAIERHFAEIRQDLSTRILTGLNKRMSSTVVAKSVNVSAGGLSAALTPEETATITDLTITGTLDARDFIEMRDNIPFLQRIDMSSAVIVAYTGSDGPNGTASVRYPANTIPAKAFYMDNKLISAALPVTLETIGYNSFCGCHNLKTITIPASVDSLATFAFYSSGLVSIRIPASLTSIGSLALNGLVSVDTANPNYSSLDGVLFDKKRTELLYCPHSKTGNYSIPDSVSTIGPYSFEDCTELTSVTLPATVKVIEWYAFQGCKMLTVFTIPPSVKSIEEGVFQYCSKITSLFVPASVTYIGDLALPCNALIAVDTINAFFSSEDGVLFNKNKTKLVLCPNSKMGLYTIPSTVDTVGVHAFSECKRLDSIIIPSSVIRIGSMAFRQCSALSCLVVCASTPVNLTSSYNVFYGMDTSFCTLYVPVGSKDAYRTADQWKAFDKIEEFTVSIHPPVVKRPGVRQNRPIVLKNKCLSFSESLVGARYSLFSLDGVQLHASTITTAGTHLDMRGYAPGCYLIKIASADIGCIVEKIRKE